MSKIMFPRHLFAWNPIGQINIDNLSIALNQSDTKCEITIATGNCIISKVISSEACHTIGDLFAKIKVENQEKKDFEIIYAKQFK